MLKRLGLAVRDNNNNKMISKLSRHLYLPFINAKITPKVLKRPQNLNITDICKIFSTIKLLLTI